MTRENNTFTTMPDGKDSAHDVRPNAQEGACNATADSLSHDLHAAYEAMEPTAEAQERMLASLLTYQDEKDGEVPVAASAESLPCHPERSEGSPGRDAAPVNPAAFTNQPQERKARPAWRIVLPVAACLVLLAGVGALAANVLGGRETSDPTIAVSEPVGKNEAAMTEGLGYAPDAAMEYDGAMAADAYIPAPGYPGDFNTEEYNTIDEPGFIAAATRPLSTFGADVDTASYANLRRLINEGYGIADVYDEYAPFGYDEDGEPLTEPIDDAYFIEPSYPGYYGEGIPKGAVRIEEMLNYFTYDYELPQGDDLFGTTVRLGECPWNPDTTLLVMGFATNPEVGQASAGRNLVFLIDTSGSMNAADKMELLQDAFNELTSQLNDNDRISIVTYSGYEEVVLDGARGGDARAIQRAIDRLDPNGSTNGEAGLKMAYEVAEKNFIEGGVNRIIMASDGDLNVGMTSESDLHDFVEGKRDSGIYLSVLGFGSGNYKDNKMETLADAGNGNYHYIDCLEEAQKVFGKDLVANLVPLANDVKLQVEFNPAQVKAYRLIGYENRALSDEDFRDDTKDAGDIGPGHQLTVAYEIVPADSKMEIPEADLKYNEGNTGDASSDEWLTCTMRYQPVSRADGKDFVVEASEPREQQLVVSGSDLVDDPGDDWRFAASVIEFGMVLRDSDYKGSATLESVEDLLAGMKLDEERRGFEKLVYRAG